MNKIIHLYPVDKDRVHLDNDQFRIVRQMIFELVETHGEVTYPELTRQIEQMITCFDGSILWYAVCLKIDLDTQRNAHQNQSMHVQNLRRVK